MSSQKSAEVWPTGWVKATVVTFFTRENPSRNGTFGFGFVKISDGRRLFMHKNAFMYDEETRQLWSDGRLVGAQLWVTIGETPRGWKVVYARQNKPDDVELTVEETAQALEALASAGYKEGKNLPSGQISKILYRVAWEIRPGYIKESPASLARKFAAEAAANSCNGAIPVFTIRKDMGVTAGADLIDQDQWKMLAVGSEASPETMYNWRVRGAVGPTVHAVTIANKQFTAGERTSAATDEVFVVTRVRRPSAYTGMANPVVAHPEAYSRLHTFNRKGYDSLDSIGTLIDHYEFDRPIGAAERCVDLLLVLKKGKLFRIAIPADNWYKRSRWEAREVWYLWTGTDLLSAETAEELSEFVTE